MPRALILLSLLFLLAACSNSNRKTTVKLQGSTMGTQYHIFLVLEPNQKVDESDLNTEVDSILQTINQQMSTYIPTSEISLFNHYKKQDWFAISEDFARVASSALQVSHESNGAFDITVSPLIELWGFGSTTQFSVPSEQQINKALKATGYLQLQVQKSPPAIRKLNAELRIDLSAIAKGFAVDKLSEYFIQKHYSNFLVEIGGEIRNRGLNKAGKPWTIGIEVPQTTQTKVEQTLLTSNIAIATSGDYRNYFIKEGVRFSHTINPATGKPVVHNLASVTVLHDSTMMADAYATAMMVLGEKKAKNFADKLNLKTHLIIRNKATGFHIWKNFDESKLVH